MPAPYEGRIATTATAIVECPLCLGEGEGPVVAGARFSGSEACWYPDERWGVCPRCQGEGVIDVCARCGAELPADESLPCSCGDAALDAA